MTSQVVAKRRSPYIVARCRRRLSFNDGFAVVRLGSLRSRGSRDDEFLHGAVRVDGSFLSRNNTALFALA
ncbi:hypothetical protein EVAR_31204_1 [Eumeta japonica]|uniref:Uncharacterized protein n=1 Tax=Eumeta variegata TaxID=151549 RepID=A0A4C1VXH9_EUMVA|nr:hypothetical protein EVAR_31204_1 [Eumeta japonica]